MKWLARNFRSLGKDDYKVLQALEKGMKKYEFVPVDVITHLSSLHENRVLALLKRLHDLKLVVRQIGSYVGYRLTVHGYDMLALSSLTESGVISYFGSSLGVGKESDVYDALTPSGKRVAIKAHRIGRSSFTHVKRVRSYVNGAITRSGWFPASCRSADREYYALKLLYSKGVAVPEPVSRNRHIVVMGFVEGEELIRFTSLPDPSEVLDRVIDNVRLAYKCGIIHGDLSEYNVMLTPEMDVFLIDWPQYLTVKHPSSHYLLERDLRNILSFFRRRFNVYLDLSEALNHVVEN